MNKKSGIYKITNPEGLVYIGASKDIGNRISKYRNKKCSKQRLLYNSLCVYGFNNHKFEVIKFCKGDSGLLSVLESFYVFLYSSTNKKYGLNLKDGGVHGVLCEESIAIISEKNKKPKSESTKNKIRMSLIGNKSPMFGKYGRDHHSSKRVIQMDLNGNFIKEYDSLMDAQRCIGVKNSKISAVCLSKKGCKTAGGFKWKYKMEEEI